MFQTIVDFLTSFCFCKRFCLWYHVNYRSGTLYWFHRNKVYELEFTKESRATFSRNNKIGLSRHNAIILRYFWRDNKLVKTDTFACRKLYFIRPSEPESTQTPILNFKQHGNMAFRNKTSSISCIPIPTHPRTSKVENNQQIRHRIL